MLRSAKALLRNATNLEKAARMATGIASHGWSSFVLARKAITQHQAVQRTWELLSLIGRVASESPRRIVEIGTHRGGTLYCWAQIAAEDARFLSLDLPGGDFGGGYSEAEGDSFRRFLRGNQQLQCLRQSSHSPQTLGEVQQWLSGDSIDFLFIDGDHTYSGVRQDFEMYSPLVRPGGLVAFHDINPNPYIPNTEVHVFWSEVKDKYLSEEFIDQRGPERYGMGIGLLRMP
jgi:predicted O-methyltransferase YrrM